ncbi:MAG: flagellar hook-associated protein FlgK [Selenomonadaceae bacterium]|nr:flagellar hook-associated protein FlgK [Selenomonadaceae bacterium]
MRSTFAGLNTMVRGINMNQLSQQTVGHNITNADTDGYSRQSVNLGATRAQEHGSVYGNVLVGTGVDALSLTRARDIYADRQYWSENSPKSYYEARAKEYDKLEAIFNDTVEGIESALGDFYKSWQTLSVYASDSSARVSVLEHGKVFADKIHSTAKELQEQIEANYEDIRMNVGKVNEMLENMVELNKSIMGAEATGASANDLRDQRDLLVDNISSYVNVNVYESSDGMYSLVSNGVSLVNGINHLTLEMSAPIANADYGINDYSILIKEAQIAYQPLSGSLKAEMDAIEEDKSYIDQLSNMAAFMLSDLNEQHQQGHGIDTTRTAGTNFFGDSNTQYVWDAATKSLKYTKYTESLDTIGYNYTVKENKNYKEGEPNYYYVEAALDETKGTVAKDPTDSTKELKDVTMKKIEIINTLALNTQLTAPNGQLLIAASGYGYKLGDDGKPYAQTPGGDKETNGIVENNEGDGANSVLVETLFNLDMTKTPKYDKEATAAANEAKRAIGSISLNAYYNKAMTELGSNAEAMDAKVKAQDEVVSQIIEWRETTAGVNWNEELTNMIMFQQGFSACSRCLTTMDEMLDRLINSTGVVGR